MTATIDTTGTGLEIRDFAAYDFYRDIHKGLRYSLFHSTEAAGSVDPADDAARAQVASQVHAVAHLLDSHAEHENEFVVPVLEVHAPELADVIHVVHPELERRVD